MFTNLSRCSQSINSLIYVYSMQIPSYFLWVLDHSRDRTSLYYRRPKKISVLRTGYSSRFISQNQNLLFKGFYSQFLFFLLYKYGSKSTKSWSSTWFSTASSNLNTRGLSRGNLRLVYRFWGHLIWTTRFKKGGKKN